MIPAYNEKIEPMPIVEDPTKQSVEQQIRMLQEQLAQLRETVEFMNRERTRLKNEVDRLSAQVNRS
jgi:phage shock protein A